MKNIISTAILIASASASDIRNESQAEDEYKWTPNKRCLTTPQSYLRSIFKRTDNANLDFLGGSDTCYPQRKETDLERRFQELSEEHAQLTINYMVIDGKFRAMREENERLQNLLQFHYPDYFSYRKSETVSKMAYDRLALIHKNMVADLRKKEEENSRLKKLAKQLQKRCTNPWIGENELCGSLLLVNKAVQATKRYSDKGLQIGESKKEMEIQTDAYPDARPITSFYRKDEETEAIEYQIVNELKELKKEWLAQFMEEHKKEVRARKAARAQAEAQKSQVATQKSKE